MKCLPVHERFHAWQGEGTHVGRSAFFIRLFGCPLHCPWCDAAGTWHPDWIPAQVERLDPEALAEEAAASRASFAVVTGGEPAIHDLTELVDALHKRGLKAHLETSGAFPIRGSFDWLTVSPKWAKPALAENLVCADELKLIIEAPDSVERWCAELAGRIRSRTTIWLQPEWSRRADAAVLAAISRAVLERGDPFRATWQLHKLYRVDEADPRSRPAAPLGGREELGW